MITGSVAAITSGYFHTSTIEPAPLQSHLECNGRFICIEAIYQLFGSNKDVYGYSYKLIK